MSTGLLPKELEVSLPPRSLPIEANPESGTLTFLELPALRFEEPFFDDTVVRARRDHPWATLTVRLFADILADEGAASAAPAGMLFHSGRCGSTLISNMLAAAIGWTVLKEPDLVSVLLAASLAREGGWQVHMDRVGAAIRLLAAAAAPCMLKLSAWNVRRGSMLRALFPNAPTVFAFRTPDETVASMMAAPPSWSSLAAASRSLQARFFPSILAVQAGASVSPLVLFAHAWRSIAEEALALGEDALFVDYAALARDPVVVVDEILAHLGATTEPIDRTAVARVAGLYAKESLPTSFDPAERHHRPPLSPMEAAIVDDITGEAWHRLRIRTAAATDLTAPASDGARA